MTDNTFLYNTQKSYNERLKEATDVLDKYPDRIPIIVEAIKRPSSAPLDKNKFLCPNDITVSQFILILKNRINLKSSESIYLFVNCISPPNSMTLGDLYKKYGDNDRFLKMKYSLENFFG